MLKDRLYDLMLGIETQEDRSFKEENINYKENPNAVYKHYMPTPYGKIESIINYLKVTGNDIFVDLGCGKARVVAFMARKKLKKVIGVELNKGLIDIAKKNIDRLRTKKTPVELINSDMANFNIKKGTIFFMFNPFDPQILKRAIGKIKESLASDPRKIRIIYCAYTPEHKHIFDKQDWLIKEGEIKDKACLVWSNKI
jgi:cyclopropane fatty-acyl-phospholipid synthase-like methyltransferase